MDAPWTDPADTLSRIIANATLRPVTRAGHSPALAYRNDSGEDAQAPPTQEGIDHGEVGGVVVAIG
jgi:hypothetical protein